MHFDGKNVIGVLFLPWILMGNKPLVTKLSTLYFYDTVKIVHLKIDKCLLEGFLKTVLTSHVLTVINTFWRQLLSFLSSDGLTACQGISEKESLTWGTLEAN